MSLSKTYWNKWINRERPIRPKPSAPPLLEGAVDLYCYETPDWDYVCNKTLPLNPPYEPVVELPTSTENWAEPPLRLQLTQDGLGACCLPSNLLEDNNHQIPVQITDSTEEVNAYRLDRVFFKPETENVIKNNVPLTPRLHPILTPEEWKTSQTVPNWTFKDTEYVPYSWEDIPDPELDRLNGYLTVVNDCSNNCSETYKCFHCSTTQAHPTRLVPHPYEGPIPAEELAQFSTSASVQPCYKQTVSRKQQNRIAATRKRLGLEPLELFEPTNIYSSNSFPSPAESIDPQPTEQPIVQRNPTEKKQRSRRRRTNRRKATNSTEIEIPPTPPAIREYRRQIPIRPKRSDWTARSAKRNMYKRKRTWYDTFPKSVLVYDRETGKFPIISRQARFADFTSQRFRYDHWTYYLDRY